jgi:hypothetical protein
VTEARKGIFDFDIAGYTSRRRRSKNLARRRLSLLDMGMDRQSVMNGTCHLMI